MLLKDRHKEVSELLPKTVKNAVNQPPLCEVAKVVGNNKVVRYIEWELVRMTSLVSVGNNLNDAQVQFIATQLVEMFPNESLADFKLCFERGCIGQYGEIYRMDGIVLRKWMEQYLEEKYQVIESDLMKEKDEHYKKINPETEKDWYKIWLESVGTDNKVPAMEDKDVRKYGQEKPVRTTATAGYKYFQVKNIQVLAVTQEHAEELVKKMIDLGELEEF